MSQQSQTGNTIVLENEQEGTPHHDKLPWRDKLPLALALVAQSYVVFIWYLRSTHGIHPYVDFVIALAAGIALDWLTVSTVMGRREGRTSIWSWLTSFGTFIGSATIAYDTYALQWWPLDGKALLHVCYPLVVLLYSLHLASPRYKKAQLAARLPAEEVAEHRPALPATIQMPEKLTTIEETVVAVPATTTAQFVCPHCDARLDSIGELGAAKRWGHCKQCKGRTTVPLTYPGEQSQNGTTPK